MKLFDWFKPLDKVIDVVDKAVVDQDAKIQIKAELQQAEIGLREMAEKTYLAELQQQTIPWVDALHKMGRQILSLLSLIAGASILAYMIHKNMAPNLETMLGLLMASGPAGIYNYVKKTGNPTS